ncbi:hypothetical protein HMPREF9554_01366 [Treponema phagedenis F0421]|nr:hypothetical protein HMPREF9554_01366 [Treponema phagedenis F0421]
MMLNPVSFTNTFALKRRFCLEPYDLILTSLSKLGLASFKAL